MSDGISFAIYRENIVIGNLEMLPNTGNTQGLGNFKIKDSAQFAAKSHKMFSKLMKGQLS